MKLRLKLGGQRKAINIDDNSTFQDLRVTIVSEFNLTSNALGQCEVSLNNKDVIHTNLNTPLSELSIVHGDLVHVHLPEDFLAQVERASSSTEHTPRTTHAVPMSTESEVLPQSTPSRSTMVVTPGCSTAPRPPSAPASAEGTHYCWGPDEGIQDSKVNQYLREPMRVCDSTPDAVPSALQTVYKEECVTTNVEAVCVLMHILMSESGFSCGTQRRRIERERVMYPLMPTGWKTQKTIRLTYNHESCPNVTFALICVPMGTLLVVHGTAVGVNLEQKCQFQFQTSDYVKNIDTDASKTFKNLVKFSRMYKDKIAHPIIQLTRQSLGHPSTTGLLGLVEEVKLLICSHLDVHSLCNISQVTNEFYRLAMQPDLWRRLYLRNFGRRTNNSLSQDWFTLYKEKHMLRREMRARVHPSRLIMPPRFVPPPFAEPDDPFSFSPDFIGGDYDRYPAIPGMPGVGPTIPRPRFDPFGALPHQFFPPGRGRGRGRGGGGGYGGFFM